MSGFAMFYLQDPSLLEFQRRFQDRIQRNNLSTVFGGKDIPDDSQLREIIDENSYEPLYGVGVFYAESACVLLASDFGTYRPFVSELSGWIQCTKIVLECHQGLVSVAAVWFVGPGADSYELPAFTRF